MRHSLVVHNPRPQSVPQALGCKPIASERPQAASLQHVPARLARRRVATRAVEAVDRRLLLGAAAFFVANAGRRRSARAEGFGEVRERIADTASAIPGYGPTDVYYPPWLQGSWSAQRELVAVEMPQGTELAGELAAQAQLLLGTPRASDRYSLRYFDYKGNVISDRAQNLPSIFLNPLRNAELLDASWEETNANVIKATLRQPGGILKTLDLRVARRAVGVPEGREEDIFNYSEFYQQTLYLDAKLPEESRPVPIEVTPVRCVGKFRRTLGPEVLEVLRFEVFPSVASESGARDWSDVVSNQRLQGSDPERPLAVYKYRVVLTPMGGLTAG
mmetsp:Transcript_27072/g.59499  ORF Transcript_27072/g.59499 Transcript_27072/m.59499 type:complete len:332 (-) Transcript_27072:6-1001(-)